MPWYIIALIIWALISFPFGVVMGRFLAQRAVPDEAEYAFDPYMTFHNQIQIDCPEGHAPKGELCDLLGVWICVERFKELEVQNWIDEDQEGDIYEYPLTGPHSYGREIGGKESLYSIESAGRWVEMTIGDCRYGCKIYENSVTRERALAHNSTYGCNK